MIAAVIESNIQSEKYFNECFNHLLETMLDKSSILDYLARLLEFYSFVVSILTISTNNVGID